MSAPKTAMVLAAGLGTRMRPLTLTRPKPLIEVGGATLLDHMLDRLRDAGVERAIVNVHYLADQIEAHVARRAHPAITISDERAEVLETGGALIKAAPLLGDAPFFVTNTDQVWIEHNGSVLAGLAKTWRDDMDALLLLAPREDCLGFDGLGDFFMDSAGRLTRRGQAAHAPWVYAGVQILHPRALEGFAPGAFSANKIWDAAGARGRLYGAPLDGYWMHVGDPGARDDAEARLAQKRPARAAS